MIIRIIPRSHLAKTQGRFAWKGREGCEQLNADDDKARVTRLWIQSKSSGES
jgi:hypothetical protein